MKKTLHSKTCHNKMQNSSSRPIKYMFPPVPLGRAFVTSEAIGSSYSRHTTCNFRAWTPEKGPPAPGWRLRANCTPAAAAKPQQLESLMSAARHKRPAHRDCREAAASPTHPLQPWIPAQSLPSSPDNRWDFPAESSIPLPYRRHNIPSWIAVLPWKICCCRQIL